MAIAVVFLIMFVFSLLASGVRSTQAFVEKQQQQAYQEAQIPEAVRNQNQKDIKSLEKSIEDIESQNQVVAEQLELMNAFAKSMAEQKKAFVRVKKDLVEKTSMMDQAHQTLNERQQNINQLRSELKERSIKAAVGWALPTLH